MLNEITVINVSVNERKIHKYIPSNMLTILICCGLVSVDFIHILADKFFVELHDKNRLVFFRGALLGWLLGSQWRNPE